MKLLKMTEPGQETITSMNEVLYFFVIYEPPQGPSNKRKQTKKHNIYDLRAAASRVCQLLSSARHMNTS